MTTDEMKAREAATIEVEQDPDWPDADLYAVSRGGRYWIGLSDEEARGLCRALNDLFGIRQPATLSPVPDEQLDEIEADLNRRVPAIDFDDRGHCRFLLAEVRRLRAEAAAEVIVEGSVFRREDLPTVLGNVMRSSAEHAREAKELLVSLTELRPVRDADTRALSSHPDEETVTTVAELDALPLGAVLAPDSTPTRAEVIVGQGDGWGTRFGVLSSTEVVEAMGPLRVLFRPTPEGSET